MSPPFSTPIPDEFVPRDVPAPSRISTTFLSPRYRTIVKSKQTPFRVTSPSSSAVSDSCRNKDNEYFQLYLLLIIAPIRLLWRSSLCPLLPYYQAYTLPSSSLLFCIKLSLLYFFILNKIKFHDLYVIYQSSSKKFLFFIYSYFAHVILHLYEFELKIISWAKYNFARWQISNSIFASRIFSFFFSKAVSLLPISSPIRHWSRGGRKKILVRADEDERGDWKGRKREDFS